MRARVLGGSAAAAVVAAGWALAAYLLWRSSVPALHLPHLDPHAYFSNRQLERTASYARGARLLWLFATLVQLAALAVFARFGARWASESASGRMGTGMLLGMLGFALVWAAQLPASVLEVWWARRHGLNTVSYLAVTVGHWLALGGTFVFLCVALAIVMGLAGPLGNWWWLPAAPCFVGLVLLFSFVTPYLLGGNRLADPGKLDFGVLGRQRSQHPSPPSQSADDRDHQNRGKAEGQPEKEPFHVSAHRAERSKSPVTRVRLSRDSRQALR